MAALVAASLSFLGGRASLHASLPPSPLARVKSHPSLRSPPSGAAEAPPLPPLLRPDLSLAIGSGLLLALVGNRLFTEDLLNSQSRADLIATVAPILLTLKGLTDLDIKEREAEPVDLAGVEQSWASDKLPESVQRELTWAADTLFASMRCSSLAVLWNDDTVLLKGMLPLKVGENPGGAVVPGPLVTRTLQKKSGAPEYLPSLQLLPGRVEFAYLPEMTQSVIVLPLGEAGAARGAFILGSDTQRAFKSDDVTWARAISVRVGSLLLRSAS